MMRCGLCGITRPTDGKVQLYHERIPVLPLWDLVSYDCKHNEANGENNTDGPDYNYSWNCGAEGPSRKRAVMTLRKHQVRNAFFLLLLAQGTPCILAGDEFYNSQKGNNNVYCQDNETGWVDWSRAQDG